MGARPTWLAAAALVAGTLLSSSPAAADGPSWPTEWRRIVMAFESPLDAAQAPATPSPAHPELSQDLLVPAPRAGWLGTAPRLSLVARDWSGSRRILGDLAPTDELRPAHSSRMAVSRLRLGGGLLEPFAQLGLGEWRIDPTLAPTLPHVREMAAQAGMGFEVSLFPGASLAVEMDWTLLHGEGGSDIVATTHPTLWGGCVAGRAHF